MSLYQKPSTSLKISTQQTKSKKKKKPINITIDYDGSRGAPPLGHDVLGYTGVVSGIGQTSLFDDQVVVDSDVKVPIIRRVDDLFVLQPLDLQI